MIDSNKEEILIGPFNALRDINYGIVLIGTYFLFEFGSLQGGVLPIVNELQLPFIVSLLSVIYAIYLLIQNRLDFKSDTTKKFILLCAYIFCYTTIATKIPEDKVDIIKLFIVYLSQYIIIVCCLKKPSQFLLLINIWLFAIMMSSFHGIMQGGKVWGNRWLKDENHISLVVATAIPFALILFRQHKSMLMKLFYLSCLILYVAVNVVAASRGGALSMILVAILSLLLFKNKLRILVMLTVATILVLSYAPDKFFHEMQTLEQGTKEGTADDRIYLWGVGMEMFYDKPVFGVGPMNYRVEFSKYERGKWYPIGVLRVPHSTPVQWLAEMGLFGSLILIMLFIALYKNWKVAFELKRSKGYKHTQEQSSIFVNVTHACAISQVGFWFGALFLSLMPYPFYWCLIPFSEAWKNLSINQINKIAEAD